MEKQARGLSAFIGQRSNTVNRDGNRSQHGNDHMMLTVERGEKRDVGEKVRVTYITALAENRRME